MKPAKEKHNETGSIPRPKRRGASRDDSGNGDSTPTGQSINGATPPTNYWDAAAEPGETDVSRAGAPFGLSGSPATSIDQ